MMGNGACLAPLWSLPPISALQTMLSLTMQEAGATLLCITLTSLSLSSNTLLNTELELCLLHTKGMLSSLLEVFFFFSNLLSLVAFSPVN